MNTTVKNNKKKRNKKVKIIFRKVTFESFMNERCTEPQFKASIQRHWSNHCPPAPPTHPGSMPESFVPTLSRLHLPLCPFTFSIFLFYYISIYIFTIPILPQNYNHNFLLPQRFVARDFIFLFAVLSYANHIKHSKIRDCVMAGNGSSCFSC